MFSGTRRLPILWSAGTETFAALARVGDDMAAATTEPVRLPPGPRIPKPVQAVAFMVANHRMFAALARRYGSSVVRVNLPHNSHAVVITDPILAKELFSTGTDLVERAAYGAGSIGAAFGPGSTFSLAGDEHAERRKLLAPPFHGKRMRSYDRIIEEEVMREIADWPEGREFETLEPMMRITVGRDLARRVRRRRSGAGRASQTGAGHGHAWLPPGRRAADSAA